MAENQKWTYQNQKNKEPEKKEPEKKEPAPEPENKQDKILNAISELTNVVTDFVKAQQPEPAKKDDDKKPDPVDKKDDPEKKDDKQDDPEKKDDPTPSKETLDEIANDFFD